MCTGTEKVKMTTDSKKGKHMGQRSKICEEIRQSGHSISISLLPYL